MSLKRAQKINLLVCLPLFLIAGGFLAAALQDHDGTATAVFGFLAGAIAVTAIVFHRVLE